MVGKEALTIDELAARTGLSVRNIRSHISRDLLPEPKIRGRTAYYDERHIDRLMLITALQQEGLNLAVIARLINNEETFTGPETTRFYHSMLSAWMSEKAKDITEDELTQALGQPVSDHTRTRLAAAGFIADTPGDARIQVRNPPLFRALTAAVAAGVLIDEVIDVQLGITGHIDAIADLFTEILTTTLHHQHPPATRSEADLASMSALVNTLRPQASAAVLATFHEAMVHSMRQAVEGILGPSQPSNR